ncbi:MAG TPA: TonB-dependent receptor [Flavitalea sp.]|nr:TonB-dependent receptor [Flavitalea sp.]
MAILINVTRIAFICLPLFSWAQTKIKGAVMNKNMQPLVAANVLLLKVTDSSLVKGSSTAKDGSFTFENVKAGDYLVMATHVGFSSVYLPPITITHSQPELGLKTISLSEESGQLQEVTVQARRPLLEQKIDRMIVNVKNSITAAGTTALNVLERSPGVIVNRQNNSISMSGKDGVMVMINGKINYMPTSALVQMLDGMNAGNIDRIELITTPPSNLDAQGNAGYINIVLINNPDFGLNGSFSATMGYGDGEVPAVSLNFNYRKDRINLFGDYSGSIDGRQPVLENYRRVINQGVTWESFTATDRHPTRYRHNLRLGLDYQLSKNTMIGVLLSGYINRYDMHETITNQNFKNSQPDTIVIINNTEVNNWRHASGNLNLQHTIKPGQTISVDADYLFYYDKQPFEYRNHYYNANYQYLFTENVRTRKKTPIKFLVGKVDYTKKFSAKVSMEAGAKATFSMFDNDVSVERSRNNNWTFDPKYTSTATLKENILAAYTAYNINPDAKTNIKLGLRYEYTNSNLGTNLKKDTIDRHYGRLFPSFFISRKISDNYSMNFSYSRRINRPTFNDMAPFIFFFDPNTFISGNSALQPSISDNVKVDFTYKRFLASLSYSYDNNSIAGFQSTIDANTGKQILFAENLDYLQTASLVLALPFEITKWWNMQNNVIGTWQQASATYLNAPFKIQQANLNIRTTQNFELPESFALELTAFYQTTSIFGRYKLEPFGQLDIGIQKKFKNYNQRLRLAVLDLFSTNKWVFSTNVQDDSYSKTSLQFSKVTVNLTYSRNFGRNSVKAARARTGASAEERGRVQ